MYAIVSKNKLLTSKYLEKSLSHSIKQRFLPLLLIARKTSLEKT